MTETSHVQALLTMCCCWFFYFFFLSRYNCFTRNSGIFSCECDRVANTLSRNYTRNKGVNTHKKKTETERNEYICWGATRESWTNNILTNFTYVRWKTERQMLWHWFFFGFSQSASKQSAQFQNNVISEMHVMTAFIWRLARARGRKNMFAFHLTFTREFVR